MADEQQIEQVTEGQAEPQAATVATPEKVEEGAAPAEKPSAKVYTQEEVDAIAARIEARADRKKQRELRELQAATQPKPVVESPVTPAAPKREDFEDYGDFIRAEARYVADRRFDERVADQDKAAKAAKAAEERKTAQQAFDKRMQAAPAKYPDFEDALTVAQGLPITDAMFEAMVAAEEGADLVYFLGKNPGEARRISQLSEKAQAVEIGKLAAKLPAPTSQTASVSKAPAPIEPIGGKTTAVSNNPPSDPDEYKVWHDNQERAKAAARRRA